MKKTFVVFIVILMGLTASLAEETIGQKIADLEKKLQKVSGKGKVDVLNDLAFVYKRRAPKKTIEYANQALKLSKRIKYKKGEARSLHNIGIGNYVLSDYGKALEYYQRVLKIVRENGDKERIAASLNSIAGLYCNLSNYDKALEYNLKSLKIWEEVGNKEDIALSLNNIGVIYYYLCDYDRALGYYLKSLKISEEIGDKKNILMSLSNLGVIYERLSNYDKALEYSQKSLKIQEEIGDKWGIAVSLNNIGIVYKKLSNYDKALEYHLKSLEMREEIGDKQVIATSLDNIGTVYKNLNNYDKALGYHLKALKMREEIGDKFGIAASLNNIGENHTKMKSYDKALLNLERGLKIAKEIKAKELIENNYKHCFELYAERGDFKKAYEYHKLYHDVNKSMFNDKSSKQINELQVRYDTLKKEKKIEALVKDNEIKSLNNKVQMAAGISLIFVLILGLIVIYRYYRHYKNELKRREEKQRSLELESRLKIFQARINPHFLFNSLDAVIGLGYQNDPQKLKETVGKLADMYRRILSAPECPTVPLREELAVVQDYLEIEKRILKNRLAFNISLNDEELLDREIIPLSILTLVENAVKHGISRKAEGGKIQVDIYQKGQFIFAEVTDSGAGFDMANARSGFGLYSIQERLRLYYRGRARFSIEALKEGGTQALLQIPCRAA
jgi:tetratricopeptide (TPR) repeat protein